MSGSAAYLPLSTTACFPLNGWTCPNCGGMRYAGVTHHCPTTVRLSPLGGGPNPWKECAR